MVPFGKQQEIVRNPRRQAQKSCQETTGRLFIENPRVGRYAAASRSESLRHACSNPSIKMWL